MINWGVIGGGKIVSRFLKSLKNSSDGRLYAAASRTEAKRCFTEGLTESPYMTLEDSLRIRRAADQIRKHIFSQKGSE